MSIALDQALLDFFRNTTKSGDASSVRSILVQTAATSKKLELVQTLEPDQSDKDDFAKHLPKLFSIEPTRSGYALFRLDTRAANGDWEWLCVAYQPDRAKVREKMQYTMTRAALLAGLDEHHFLDTIYASEPLEFLFPSKLRNARKHDYQNPQQKTAGKAISEATGTDAGGARKNFGTRHQGGSDAPTAQGSAESQAIETVHQAAASEKTSHEVEKPIQTMQPEKVAAPKEEASNVNKFCEAVPRSAMLMQTISTINASANLPLSAAAATSKEADQTSFDLSEHSELLPPGNMEHAAAASRDVEDKIQPTATAVTPIANELADEQFEQKSKAPEEQPVCTNINENKPAGSSDVELSKPLVPSAWTIKEQLDTNDAPITSRVTENPAATDISIWQLQDHGRTSAPVSALSTNHKAADQSAAGSHSNGQSGPPSTPGLPNEPFSFSWTTDAEAAISGLTDQVSGSSEYNFVPLVASTSSKSVEIHSPPRFVRPGDLKKAFTRGLSQEVRENTLILCIYRYPVDVNARKVAFLYSRIPKSSSAGPISSTFFAAAVDAVQQRSEELSGLKIERGYADALYGPFIRPSPSQTQEVRNRIDSIRYRIKEALKACGRSETAARLVAVSKLHPPSSIMAAYAHAGQRHFGENYVQELVDKAKVLPEDIKWHFVGGLQSNKGKALAGIKNLWCVETLDSIKAANILEKALAASKERKADKLDPLRVYLQVNTSGEEAKSGIAPVLDTSDTEGRTELFDLAKHVVTACPHLFFAGLMTIGSAANSRSSSDEHITDRAQALEANPDFSKLDESRKNVTERLRAAQIKPARDGIVGYAKLLDSSVDVAHCLELSMGMTADFEVAIAAGSANVRVGTACFGERPASRDEARKGMEAELTGSVGQGGGLTGTGAVEDKGFVKPKRSDQKR